MAPEILVTTKMDMSVKKEIAVLSITKATDQAEAIAALKAKALELGANAIIGLCVSPAVLDPHFDCNRIYAHGKAAIV